MGGGGGGGGGGGLSPVALGLAGILLFCLVHSTNAQPHDLREEEEELLNVDWDLTPTPPKCRGTLAECLDGEDLESGTDPDLHRRILYPLRYISYGALRRENIPCSVRGASYYNCRPGAQGNPYRRGCSAIARCRTY